MKRGVSRRLRGVDIDRVDGAHENDVVNFEHRFLFVFYFVFSSVFPIFIILVLPCRRRRRFLHRWCLFFNNRFLFAVAFFLYYGGFFTIVDDIRFHRKKRYGALRTFSRDLHCGYAPIVCFIFTTGILLLVLRIRREFRFQSTADEKLSSPNHRRVAHGDRVGIQ